MPDDDPIQGQQSFLDRISDQIDNADPEPGTQTPDPNTPDPDPKPTPDVPDLTPEPGDPEPKGDPDSGDGLDNLEPKPKDAPKPEGGGDPKGEGEGDGGEDPLATFDEADRAKIQAYIDDQVAAEVTASESAGGAFKRLKAENRELRAERDEAKASSGDPEALTAATARIKELEEAQTVREQQDSVLKLEETQAWADTVVSPLTRVLEASDKIAERYGVDKVALSDALELTDRRQLSETVSQLLGEDAVEADKFELFDLARQVEGVYEKRKELRENASEALREAEELAAKAEASKALEARQEREAAVEGVIENITSKAKFITDLMGDEVLADAKTDIAERGVDALSPAELAHARVAAKALRPMAQKILTLERDLQEVSDQLAARKKAAPGSSTSGGSGAADNPEPEKVEGNFADRLSAKIGAVA